MLSNRPNFFCIGTQKAGTTSLFQILRQHPQLYLPSVKEDHFFDIDAKFAQGIDWYAATYFAGAERYPVRGAMTPDYLYFPKVPERMAATLGTDLKFLVVLRHPVERAYSHYLMSKRRGYETLPFEQAIEREQARIGTDHLSAERYSYMSRGCYFPQLERYVRLFGRDRLLILQYESQICRNLGQSLEAIQDFLVLPRVSLPLDVKANVAAEPKVALLRDLIFRDNPIKRLAKACVPNPALRARIKQCIERLNLKRIEPRLDPALRARLLREHFAADMQQLQQVFGLDLKDWQ